MKKYNSNVWSGKVSFGGDTYSIGPAKHDDIMKAYKIIQDVFSDAELHIVEMEVEDNG